MRTNRKNVLISLGLIVAISGAALGSGAFTSVEADRGVTVNTAGDADAFLAITPGDGYGGNGYISNDSSEGAMTFDLGDEDSETNSSGQGFNQNATTNITSLIQLENQGNNAITVGFENADTPSNTTTVDVDQGTVTFEIEDSPDLETGETANVSVSVNTSAEPTTVSDSPSVTIYATE
ncbi:hypothetical protein [Natrinema limicola]|nr:hypothetical protein [Natrinema limicola]